jgi:predicted nucleotidyltransferase
MPSVVRSRSSGSVRVFSADWAALKRKLKAVAERVARDRSEVTRIMLFGSLSQGTATPGSDADILVVVKETAARIVDRPLPYLPFFVEVGVGVDVFVYTEAEVAADEIPLLKNALSAGESLFGRP